MDPTGNRYQDPNDNPGERRRGRDSAGDSQNPDNSNPGPSNPGPGSANPGPGNPGQGPSAPEPGNPDQTNTIDPPDLTDQEIVLKLAAMYEEKDRLLQQLALSRSTGEMVDIQNKLNECGSKIKDAILQYSKEKDSLLSLDYKLADPSKYLVFGDPSKSGIDPIFAGRLAALAKDAGIKIYIWPNGAYRDYEGQVREYIASGGHQNPDGSWSGGNGKAKPGNSWHGFGEAIDIWAGKPGSTLLKKLYEFDNVKNQTLLLGYGLGKTLTVGAIPKPSFPEDWHIQPIETFGIVDINVRKSFHDAYTK